MHMMSDLLKLGLRILMASGRLELTVRTIGAALTAVAVVAVVAVAAAVENFKIGSVMTASGDS